MRVKIGNKWFDSELTPLAVQFTDDELACVNQMKPGDESSRSFACGHVVGPVLPGDPTDPLVRWMREGRDTPTNEQVVMPIARVVDHGNREGWIAQGIGLQWVHGADHSALVGQEPYTLGDALTMVRGNLAADPETAYLAPKLTAELVRKLREETGYGLMACKAALVKFDCDYEQAKEYLRTSGQVHCTAHVDYDPSSRKSVVPSDEDGWIAFADACVEKMEKSSREKNRGGWQGMDGETLSRMLREHVEKGDPVDVANFCMMLHQTGHGIHTPAADKPTWAELVQAVGEVQGSPFEVDKSFFIGHQMTGINFNSLARIVDMFRSKPTSPEWRDVCEVGSVVPTYVSHARDFEDFVKFSRWFHQVDFATPYAKRYGFEAFKCGVYANEPFSKPQAYLDERGNLVAITLEAFRKVAFINDAERAIPDSWKPLVFIKDVDE